MARRPDIKHLQNRIGYQFEDTRLLHEALTHSSAVYGQPGMADYERLEFLGDRVLGLAIAEYLLQAFPADAEGDLARRFNGLVRKETCMAVAEELDLGPHIRLGDSEAMAGGRRKDTILANACEALLGAVYLDGGWEPAKQLVIEHWSSRLAEVITVPVDAKTALQEWVQSQANTKLPRYVLVSNSGPDHAPEFVYEVQVTGYEPARGTGPSRRKAEQAAAAALLTREGVWKASNE